MMSLYKPRKYPDPTALEIYWQFDYELIPLHRYDSVDIHKGKKKPRGKTPLHRDWRVKKYKRKEIRDNAQSRNTGVRLGRKNLIIDVDPRNFPEGDNVLKRFVEDSGLDLSKVPSVNTGAGGTHYYFKRPPDVSIVKSLPDYPGIDFLSVGSFALAAGSVHPNGNLYEWDDWGPSLMHTHMLPTSALRLIERPSSSADTQAEGGEITPEQLSIMLDTLDPENFRDQGEWFTLMQACHHASAGEGRTEFIEWSTKDPVYADHEWLIGNRWDSLDAKKKGGVTILTLYKILRDAGQGDIIPKSNVVDDFSEVPVEDDAVVSSPKDEKSSNKVQLHAVELNDFIKKEFPPRELILSPILHTQSLSMLFAVRGAGKTFVAIGIALAIATGGKFLKWEATKPRRVLLLDGEMSAVNMQERLIQALNNLPAKPENGFFRLITPDLQTHGMPDIATLEGQDMLEPFVEDADFIVIDNISTLVRSGRENEAEAWQVIQNWALRLRSRGKSVLFVHHAGKAGLQRGTSKREDVLDLIVRLQQPSDYTPEQGACFQVHYDKARNLSGPDARPFEAQLVEGKWVCRPIQNNQAIHAGKLKEQGLSSREVAKEMKVSPSKAYRLIKDSEKEFPVDDEEGEQEEE